MDNQYETIEEVYEVIRSVVIKLHDELPRKHKENMEYFSKLLFGDKHKWIEGTLFEERRERIHREHKERKEVFQKISFLYDLLSIHPMDPKKDLVRQIFKDKDICFDVISASDDILKDRELLYRICLNYAGSEIANGGLKYSRYYIINKLSTLLYKSPDHWLNDLDISRETVKKLIGRQPTEQTVENDNNM